MHQLWTTVYQNISIGKARLRFWFVNFFLFKKQKALLVTGQNVLIAVRETRFLFSHKKARLYFFYGLSWRNKFLLWLSTFFRQAWRSAGPRLARLARRNILLPTPSPFPPSLPIARCSRLPWLTCKARKKEGKRLFRLLIFVVNSENLFDRD